MKGKLYKQSFDEEGKEKTNKSDYVRGEDTLF